MGAFTWLSVLVEWFGQFFPRWYVLSQVECGVRWTLGNDPRPLKHGFVVWWPLIQRVAFTVRVSQIVDLKEQVVTTRDGVAVACSGWFQYEITDPIQHLALVHNADAALETIGLQAVKEAVTGALWTDHQEDPESLDLALRGALEDVQGDYGVRVIAAGLSDLARTRPVSLLGGGLVRITNG